jgi:hypothetical protein
VAVVVRGNRGNRGQLEQPQSWFAAGTTIVAIGNRMIRGNRNVSPKGMQSRFATMVAIGDDHDSWQSCFVAVVVRGNRDDTGARAIATLVPRYTKFLPSRFVAIVAMLQSRFVTIVARGQGQSQRDDIGARAIATLVPRYTKSLPSRFVAIVAMLQSRSVTIVVRGSCGVFLWELRPHTPNMARMPRMS